MPLLDLQRRGQQIGRIRTGEQVSTGKKNKDGTDKMRPSRLATFRFTTPSRFAAEAVAELYGGTACPWEGQHQVITDRSEIGVTAPPRDGVISQWYEMWSGGGCLRRCDSQREQISAGACLCPHAVNLDDEDEVSAAAFRRADMARENPPQACKLTTRISVMIPDLPGLGVWRLDTHSYYAAVEIGDSAELMQMARDKGVFLPAMVRIEQRKRVAGGQTKKYPVLVFEVLATFRDIISGRLEAGGIAAQLPPAPGEQRRALTAGPTTPVVPPQRPAADDSRFATVLAGIRDGELAVASQRIADTIPGATTAGQMTALKNLAAELGVQDEWVCTDEDSNISEALPVVWRARWDALLAAAQGSAAPVHDGFPDEEMVS